MSNNTVDFEKYNDEEFTIAVQFHRNMELSDSIVLGASSVSAVDSDGVDATGTVLTVATLAVIDSTVVGTANALSVWVKAGTVAGSAYTITFNAVTTDGNKFKKIVKMKIRE
jgi:hypothetical protein